MKICIRFSSYFAHFFLKREMFHTEVVDKTRAHFLCSVTFFFVFKLYRLCYNVENILERRRLQMTIWRMRIGCWIPMTTNPHTEVG